MINNKNNGNGNYILKINNFGLCKVVGSFVKINMWDLMEDKCKKLMFLNSLTV
ncbi:MAG: hypothetical protein LBM96_02865 [Methanobrevibacter sp.]|jgi:hypothetical protein|nr:hypothetical protein [Candidatus Methanoflexus mossambicus]